MQEWDEYLSISKTGESLFKDKGSKFYGFAFSCSDEEQAKLLIEEVRKIHPKNRHLCYAWRFGFDENQYRSNDDGEPSGSAGKPIYNAILSKNLRNVLIIVVRYFGGTLLGVPGLINAYKSAAVDAIEVADTELKTINDSLTAHFDFPEMNEVMRIIKDFGLKIIRQTFDTRCGLEFEVRKSLTEKVLERFVDLRSVEVVQDIFEA